MADLNLTYDNQEDIPEALRDYYAEQEDGTFRLVAEGVKSEADVQAVQKALKKEREKRREFEKRANRISELMPDVDLEQVEEDQLNKALSVLKGEEPDDPDDKGGKHVDIDKIKDAARKPLERDLETYKGEAEKWRNLAQRTLIDHALSNELTRAGVKDPDYRELLTERFRRQCRIDESEDGEFAVVMDGEYGELEPGKWIKEWASTDYAKKFIGAPDNLGGGASGGGRGTSKIPNPWKKETENFDEQMRLAREDPERAKRMASEAGKSLPI